ncbi:MAG: hypothetical protein KKF41_10310 [Actinobacteria bacterium]|nr:hypothetical protein [Actinomycetota bacterium]MBU1943087.1 hypothetical protein [Actinomycetota bacterium]MBU2687966.1 hypothetical protein [Actinomycetota bacterium]
MAAALVVMVSAGCGSGGGPGSSNPNPQATNPANSGSGPGTYEVNISGVDIALTLPSLDDLKTEKIDSLYSAVKSSTKEKVEPFLLGTCLLANHSGESTNLGFVSFDVVLNDGTRLHSNPADTLVAGWRDQAKRGEDQVLARRAEALMPELTQMVPVGSGGTGTAYYSFSDFDLGEIRKIEAWYSKGDMKPHVMVKKKPEESE